MRLTGAIILVFAHLSFRYSNAITLCPKSENDVVFYGRRQTTISAQPFHVLNYTSVDSCTQLCRMTYACKSFAHSDESCSLYSTDTSSYGSRRLIRDISSTYFDSYPIYNQEMHQDHFGKCSKHTCQNGALCQNDCSERSYSCICKVGFRGIDCEHGISNKLILQTTQPIQEAAEVESFELNGNIYILIRQPNIFNISKYNKDTATVQHLHTIDYQKIERIIVFKIKDDVFITGGTFYRSGSEMTLYYFNPTTENVEDIFHLPCGRCSASFLLDKRGNANLFVSILRDPGRTVNSHMYRWNRAERTAVNYQSFETIGVDTSVMFEVDGYSFLVIGNTKYDNNNDATSSIWRHDHDYGRTKTASIFAIFIQQQGGVWILVFKAVSGVDDVDLYTLWSTDGTLNANNTQAHALDNSLREHYKSGLVDSWENVEKVKVALYDDGKSKLSLIFNAADAGKLEWFTKDRLLNSPWSDIQSKTPIVFAMQYPSQEKRYWYIADAFGGCDVDKMWMVVSSFESCNYEQSEPRPMFLYSDKKTSKTFYSDAFLGCYLDNGPERALSSYIREYPGITAWECLDICYGLDHIYAGVDILNKACYCGDSGYATYGTASCQRPTTSDRTLMMETAPKWKHHQTLTETRIPLYALSFHDNKDHYIIIQNSQSALEMPIYTLIYKWNKGRQLFDVHQKISNQYTYKSIELVKAYGRTYLILPGHSTADGEYTLVKTEFWRLEGQYFVKHFDRQHCRSFGWSSYVVDNELYLVESQNVGSPCDQGNNAGSINIYKWI